MSIFGGKDQLSISIHELTIAYQELSMLNRTLLAANVNSIEVGVNKHHEPATLYITHPVYTKLWSIVHFVL